MTDELGRYKRGITPQNCLDSTEKIKYFTITQVSKQSRTDLEILSILNLNLFLQRY